MATNSTSRVLIGTMYSGENEYEECRASIRSQTHRNWEHFEIRHRPNKDAHEQLYQAFMARSSEFDLFCKLDADMVFSSAESLAWLVAQFVADPELDHLEIAVHDWFSDSSIMGAHVYSARASWSRHQDSLFVDPRPQIPGRYRAIPHPASTPVLHSPNPSPFQAYHFGVHRALKVLQEAEPTFNIYQYRAQWRLLRRVWNHFVRSGDERLGFAVLGAEEVFAGLVTRKQYDYTDPVLRVRFARHETLTARQLEDRLSPMWSVPWTRTTRVARVIVPHLPALALEKVRHWFTLGRSQSSR